MVSGAQQGLLLHTLVRLAKAKRVLEVGCFTGYATLWMALGLPKGGTLLSLERDDRCAAVARRHLDLSGAGEKVELRVGDALDSIHALSTDEGPFDLVFLDADKKRCSQYLELLLEKELLSETTLVLVDNVLWKGQVLDRLTQPPMSDDVAASLDGPARRSTALRDALHGFSMRVAADERVRQLMLPLRDGLTWVQPKAPWEQEEDSNCGSVDVASVELERSSTPAAAVGVAKGDAVEAVSNDGRLPTYLKLVGSAEPAQLSTLRQEASSLGLYAPAGTDAAAGIGSGDGALHGRLLHTLVRLAKAKRVLEVGCFTGYATLWMALGLPKGGTLLSLERDDRCAAVARRHLDLSGAGEKVELRVGDALDSIHALSTDEGPFDLAVWRCSTTQASGTDAQRALLNALIDRLDERSGVLVLLQPPPAAGNSHAMRQESIHDVIAADASLQVVSLPSPDGDGSLVSCVSRVLAA